MQEDMKISDTCSRYFSLARIVIRLRRKHAMFVNTWWKCSETFRFILSNQNVEIETIALQRLARLLVTSVTKKSGQKVLLEQM